MRAVGLANRKQVERNWSEFMHISGNGLFDMREIDQRI